MYRGSHDAVVRPFTLKRERLRRVSAAVQVTIAILGRHSLVGWPTDPSKDFPRPLCSGCNYRCSPCNSQRSNLINSEFSDTILRTKVSPVLSSFYPELRYRCLFLSFSLSIEIYRGFGETKGARDKRGERKLRPRRESFVRTSVSKSSAAAVRRAILSLRFLPPPSRPFVFVETTVVFQEERDTFQEQVCRIYNLGRKRIELPSSYQPSILCFFACIRRFVDRSPLPSERSLLASVLCKIIV